MDVGRERAVKSAVYQSSELPKLNVETDDSVANMRIPRIARQLRRRLLLAIALAPPAGAVAVVLYMQLAG